MNPTLELIEAIYADKVRRARMLPIERKLTSGPMLFEFACSASRAGIRAQHPAASPAEIERLLRNRLALADRLEKNAWTQTQ